MFLKRIVVLGVQLDGGVDNAANELPDGEAELVHWALQVVAEDGVVDGEEGVGAGEDHRERGKVPLQPWVDGEAACCRVHASHVLDVVDVLLGQLRLAVPWNRFSHVVCATLDLSSPRMYNKSELSIPISKHAIPYT